MPTHSPAALHDQRPTPLQRPAETGAKGGYSCPGAADPNRLGPGASMAWQAEPRFPAKRQAGRATTPCQEPAGPSHDPCPVLFGSYFSSEAAGAPPPEGAAGAPAAGLAAAPLVLR